MPGHALARCAFLPVLAALTLAYPAVFEALGTSLRALADARAPKRARPAVVLPSALRGPSAATGPSSAVALARAGDDVFAIVADEDRSALLVFAVPRPTGKSPRLVTTLPLAGRPTSVLVTPEGTIVVALRDRGEVALVRPSHDGTLALEATVPACTEPVNLALAPDGARIAVACAWGGEVAELDVATRKRLAHVAVAREPRAVAYDAGGDVYVTHAVGGVVSTVDFTSRYATDAAIVPDEHPDMPQTAPPELFGWGGLAGGGARIAVTNETETPASISLGQGFTFAILRNDKLVVPELAAVTSGELARTVRSSGYGGSIETSVPAPSTESEVAFVDPRAPHAAAVRLGLHAASCRLPRASVLAARGTAYFVTCFDRAHVAGFDVTGDRPRPLGPWSVADGPTGVAWVDELATLVVWSQFDRVLTTIEPFEAEPNVAFASDTGARAPTPYEVGRKLFHATDHPGISNDGRACATCHPDGRDDGRVWSSPEGPRQTPMLAGRLATSAPFGWNGESKTVREHLQKTFKRLGGDGLRDDEMFALLTYLARMPGPPPLPARALAQRGEAIFRSRETGCASCHDPDEGFRDGEAHDVGSKTPADRSDAMDTPSLRFVAKTAPYFHDGRYASLRELIAGVDGTMGKTAHLSSADRDALAAYLETL